MSSFGGILHLKWVWYLQVETSSRQANTQKKAQTRNILEVVDIKIALEAMETGDIAQEENIKKRRGTSQKHDWLQEK